MTRRLRTWQIFGLLVVASAVLSWAENEFVMTPEVYRKILGSQLDAERIEKNIRKNFLSLMTFMDVQYVMVGTEGLLSRKLRMSIWIRIGMQWKRAVILPMSL